MSATSPTGLNGTAPRHTMFVTAADGTRLAVDVHRPDTATPVAAVIDLGLPHHAGIGSWSDARRRVLEAGFAVVVLHLRGTGASTGRRADGRDHDDLVTVAEWATAQPWCSGRVGALGTGPGAQTILAAAVRRPAALAAAVVAHGTDVTTDDYFRGGALRAMALLRTGAAALAGSLRPPAPHRWAPDGNSSWVDEWRRRVETVEPDVLTAIRTGHPTPDDTSLSTGPEGAGMQRIDCPIMLVTGWVDGRSDIAIRAAGHMPRFRLVAGPWGDGDPAVARPGPHLDIVREMIRHFDEHLRRGPRAAMRRGQIYVRRPAAPQVDLDHQPGDWVEIDVWPPVQLREEPRRTRADNDEVDELAIVGDVGVNSADSRVGDLPWGMPLDQLPDNARSVTYDWMHKDELTVVGIPEVTMQVRTSVPAGQVSVKLCDIAPDGTSTLITRGMLDLSQRGRWPADPFGEPGAPPAAVPVGDWIDLRIAFEATSWTLVRGHRLRLAITGGDWPNCWPPRHASTLGVRRGSVRVVLWSPRGLPAARDEFVAVEPPSRDGLAAPGGDWRYEYDILRHTSLVHISQHRSDITVDGLAVEHRLVGTLAVDTRHPATARLDGTVDEQFEIDGQECRTSTEVHIRSDDDTFDVEITVSAHCGGDVVAERTWSERIPRP